MIAYLALDPERLRVTMQDREFSDSDLPSGLRGLGWSFRVGEVSDEDYANLMAATIPGDEMDALHRDAWTAAGPTPWPEP